MPWRAKKRESALGLPGIRRLCNSETISFNVRSRFSRIRTRICCEYFSKGEVLPPRSSGSLGAQKSLISLMRRHDLGSQNRQKLSRAAQMSPFALLARTRSPCPAGASQGRCWPEDRHPYGGKQMARKFCVSRHGYVAKFDVYKNALANPISRARSRSAARRAPRRFPMRIGTPLGGGGRSRTPAPHLARPGGLTSPARSPNANPRTFGTATVLGRISRTSEAQNLACDTRQC